MQRSSQKQRDHKRVDCYEARVELDLYPDHYLVDTIGADQHSGIKEAVLNMLGAARHDGLQP